MMEYKCGNEGERGSQPPSVTISEPSKHAVSATFSFSHQKNHPFAPGAGIRRVSRTRLTTTASGALELQFGGGAAGYPSTFAEASASAEATADRSAGGNGWQIDYF